MWICEQRLYDSILLRVTEHVYQALSPPLNGTGDEANVPCTHTVDAGFFMHLFQNQREIMHLNLRCAKIAVQN